MYLACRQNGRQRLSATEKGDFGDACYRLRERLIDLMRPRGTPETCAISRSWISTNVRAGASPSRPPRSVAGTLRFEVCVPSSYKTSNSTKLLGLGVFLAMTVPPTYRDQPSVQAPARRLGPPCVWRSRLRAAS